MHVAGDVSMRCNISKAVLDTVVEAQQQVLVGTAVYLVYVVYDPIL